MYSDSKSRFIGDLVYFGITAILLLASIAAFCMAADPYMIFDTPTLAGVNEVKPRAYQQASLAKAHLLERMRPRTLILGNSRAEIGLDPGSPEWPQDLHPVFNAAQAGAGYDVALERLREALADDGRLSLVVLGVDFQDFLVAPTSVTWEAARGTGAIAGLVQPSWTTLATTTLTLGALQDSLMTLFGQDTVTGVTMRADGFNPLRDYNVHIRRIGQFGVFAQKQADYRAQYPPRPHPDFTKPDALLPYRLVREIVDLALSHGIRIVLIIHPYHGTYLDMLTELGFKESFCAWIRSMVLLVDGSAGTARGADARLVDFSGYNAFTLEPLPPKEDRVTNMRWYWESGHYRGALGDRILKRLFGADVGFGVELASSGLGPLDAKARRPPKASAASPGFCSAVIAVVRRLSGQRAALSVGP